MMRLNIEALKIKLKNININTSKISYFVHKIGNYKIKVSFMKIFFIYIEHNN